MKTVYVDTASRSIADLCPPEDHSTGPGWLISRITVPFRSRGQGLARRLLQQILDDADREKVTLFLWICPSGGLGYTALKAWYLRHGFVMGPGEYFQRVPR